MKFKISFFLHFKFELGPFSSCLKINSDKLDLIRFYQTENRTKKYLIDPNTRHQYTYKPTLTATAHNDHNSTIFMA